MAAEKEETSAEFPDAGGTQYGAVANYRRACVPELF